MSATIDIAAIAADVAADMRAPRFATRKGDPHVVFRIDGEGGDDLIPHQLREGQTLEQAWQDACADGVFVSGETVEIGIVFAFLIHGERLHPCAVTWIDERIAPQVFDTDADGEP